MSTKFVQVAGKTPSMNTNCKHAHILLHAEHYGFFIQMVNVYTDAYNTNWEVYKQPWWIFKKCDLGKYFSK